MRPLLLHLDQALTVQDALTAAATDAGGRRLYALDLGPALRLWSRPPALAALRERLAASPAQGPELTFAGSGDFHHVTPMLIERAMAAAGEPRVTVVHFDNHPDWVRFDNGLHCGSWVGRAARLPSVARLVTVGVCSRDIERPQGKGADLALIEEGRLELYPYREPGGRPSLRLCGREWPSIEVTGEAGFAPLMLSRIATDAVYITIDKDVLRCADAATNWDQGQMSLDLLQALIEAIAADHRLIGADVVGDWSEPVYGGGMAALLKHAEALIDQPRGRPDAAGAISLNQAANLRLLDIFRGLAA